MAVINQLATTVSRQSSNSSNNEADGQMKGEQPGVASPTRGVGIGNQAKARDGQPRVFLSVKNDDPTVLTALIDRTASRKKIIDDLRRALPQFAVPYRELKPKIVEAIQAQSRENITFEEASTRVFGTPNRARTIRYWRNKWGLQ
jgi:hypothetical protein